MVSTDVAPPEGLRFRRKTRLIDCLKEIWEARPLSRALAEREIRAAYKQAGLGIAWAIVSPVMLMIVFTIFFQRFTTVSTNGVPYALFSYIALVPWNFYSTTLSNGGMSLVTQMALVNKIRCPREAFPLASMLVSGFNSIIAVGVLLILFVINWTAPKPTSVFIVFPLAVQLIFTTACLLIVSSVTVFLRDLRHAVPILLQLGLFATPIAYGMSLVPQNLQLPYVILNPLAACIDAYRDCVLNGTLPNWGLLIPAALSSLVLFYVAIKVFRRLEVGFADEA
jgi:ABC-2 type transport system permease protein/lipopolysaccharide transport system permease protein